MQNPNRSRFSSWVCRRSIPKQTDIWLKVKSKFWDSHAGSSDPLSSWVELDSPFQLHVNVWMTLLIWQKAATILVQGPVVVILILVPWPSFNSSRLAVDAYFQWTPRNSMDAFWKGWNAKWVWDQISGDGWCTSQCFTVDVPFRVQQRLWFWT